MSQASPATVSRRIASWLVAAPAIVVAALFVARPEALGSPSLKLLLMTGAACLLMLLGELSAALGRLLQEGWEAVRPARSGDQQSVLDMLTGANLTASPESTRFS
jgi:hypothetical protein